MTGWVEMLFASMGLLTFSVVLVAILRRWRAIGPALALYAVAIAAAHWSALGPGAGLAKLAGGLAAAGILIRSAAVEPEPEAAEPSTAESLAQLALLTAVAVALIAAYVLTLFWPLGSVGVLSFAWYWLLAIGALVLLSARTHLRMGVGLLLLLGAGETLAAGLSRPADLTFPWAGALAEVLLALAVARLAAAARTRREAVDA